MEFKRCIKSNALRMKLNFMCQSKILPENKSLFFQKIVQEFRRDLICIRICTKQKDAFSQSVKTAHEMR